MQRTLQRKKQKNIIYFIKKMYILIKKKLHLTGSIPDLFYETAKVHKLVKRKTLMN